MTLAVHFVPTSLGGSVVEVALALPHLLVTRFVFQGRLVDFSVPVCPVTGASSSLTAGCQHCHFADPIVFVSLSAAVSFPQPEEDWVHSRSRLPGERLHRSRNSTMDGAYCLLLTLNWTVCSLSC